MANTNDNSSGWVIVPDDTNRLCNSVSRDLVVAGEHAYISLNHRLRGGDHNILTWNNSRALTLKDSSSRLSTRRIAVRGKISHE